MKKILPYNQQQHALLLTLSKCQRKHCKHLFNHLEVDLTKIIVDIINNILHENILINKPKVKKLKKYKQLMYRLVNKKDSLYTKQKLINQKGGGLLSLLIPIIGSILSNT